MATWKKIAVSGSAISQFANDTGYLTSTTQQDAYATASIFGVELRANDSAGNLIFDTGSETGIILSGSAGNDTITFSLNSIPNSSLANSTISGISLGNNLAALTAGTGLSAGGTYNGSTARTFELDYTGSNNYIDVATNLEGSAIDSLDSIPYNDATDGIVKKGLISDLPFTNNAGTVTSVTGGVGISSSLGTTPEITLTVDELSEKSGALVGSDRLVGTSGTTNFAETIDQIPLSIFSNDLEASGGANRVLTSDGDGTYTAEANLLFTGTQLTVTGDQIITGDLTVQGTASFQETTNLSIADRFIRLASGSAGAGDGGIVVQQSSATVGELFGFDSGTTRWALTSSFDASLSAFTPDAYIAAALIGAGTDPTAVNSRYQAAGNIFIGTDEEIWIYS